MTDYVIDSNILMGMLISGKGSYRHLLSHYHFILPEFALVELEKYQDTVRSNTRLDKDQLRRFTYNIFSKLTILPAFILTEEAKQKAEELTKDIDIKDMTYVALALQLDLILLTRDKPLITGLRKKGFRKVLLFEEFLKKI